MFCIEPFRFGIGVTKKKIGLKFSGFTPIVTCHRGNYEFFIFYTPYLTWRVAQTREHDADLELYIYTIALGEEV